MRSRSPEPLPTSTSIFGDGISSAAGKAEPSSMVAGGSCAENVDMATAGSTMRAEKMFEEQLAPEKSIDRYVIHLAIIRLRVWSAGKWAGKPLRHLCGLINPF